MFSSLRLGRFFGIDVYLHASFWIIPLLAFFGGLEPGGVPDALVKVAFVLAVFGCVLLHEFGHALAARQFGIATRDITLYPIGGVARLERLPPNGWDEFWIALAGPAVNVVLAVLLAAGVLALSTANSTVGTILANAVMTDLLLVNCLLAAFNLIPAFPMDGGRVFRALLVPFKGLLRATEIATLTGNFIAFLLVLLGVATLFVNIPLFSWLLIPLGLFVILMGRQELAMVRFREMRRTSHGFRFQEEPVTVEPADGVVVRPVEARAGGFTGYLWDEQTSRWVEWRDGRPSPGLHTHS